MHVAAIAKPDVDAEAAAAAALGMGVRIHTLSRYFLGEPDRSGMIFGYGAADLPQIAQGCAGSARPSRAISRLRRELNGGAEAAGARCIEGRLFSLPVYLLSSAAMARTRDLDVNDFAQTIGRLVRHMRARGRAA